MYNVEKYIDKCIQSILLQSINQNDFEIILVDDKSTDNTLKSVEKWLDHDNIKLIKKESNTGLSDTRNKGLAIAEGDYVLFIDSDDYIEKSTLQTFYDIIFDNQPDVIYGGYIEEYGNGKYYKRYGYKSTSDRMYTASDYMKSELKHRNLFAPAPFAAYKTNLIISNNLFFKIGILHEDEQWTPRVLMEAKTVYLSSFCFYHYFKRQGSITTRKDRTKNGLDLISTCTELEKVAIRKITDKLLLKLYFNQLAKLYMKAASIGELWRAEYRGCVDRLFPIKHAIFPFDIVKSLLFLFSIRAYCKLNTFTGKE